MTKKIVIIEDDPKTVRLIDTILKPENYNIVFSGDGEDGFNMIKLHRPNLIITDILLPKLDGYIICEMVRNDPDLKSIPIILLSAIYISEMDKKRGLQIGADRFLVKPDAFISKPFRSNLLIENIKVLLGEKKRIEEEPEKDVIVIIDDDQKLLRLLEMRLEDKGYKVFSAVESDEGVELIELEQPDLVLLDYQLKDENGLDILMQIKENSPDIAVVIMTAYGTEKIAVEAMRKGADDYLIKPIDMEMLISILNENIEKAKLKSSQIKLNEQLKKISTELLERVSRLEGLNRELNIKNEELRKIQESLNHDTRKSEIRNEVGIRLQKMNKVMVEIKGQIEMLLSQYDETNAEYKMLVLVKKNFNQIEAFVNEIGAKIDFDIKPYSGGGSDKN